MTPDTLKQANLIDDQIEFLSESLESWERKELPANTHRGDCLAVPYAGITRAAWIDFRDACRAELQRQIDAKRAELADL